MPYSISGPNGSERTGEVTYGGFQSLRVAAGPSIPLGEGIRAEILLHLTAGRFSTIRGTGCGNELRCGDIPDAERATHAFLGTSIGLALEP
jgi:hypothetical protein